MQEFGHAGLALLFVALALFASSKIHASDTESCAQDGTAKLGLSSMALYNAREDLRLWRELEIQDIDNSAVKQIVANKLILHIVTVGAADIDFRDLKGASLEALCLLTTDEVKGIVERYGNEELAAVSLSYIESVEEDVVDYVREVQTALGGTGCGLSPGRPSF